MLLAHVTQMLADPRIALDPKAPVVLMVSGGSDSTALAYLMAEAHADGAVGPLRILHVNHHLRGEASDGDAAFVGDLAEKLGMPCSVVDLDIEGMAQRENGNLEAIARRERYAAASDALRTFCSDVGVDAEAGCLCTAHTADDRAENFYMRSIVGTGPGGFRSMDYRSVLPNDTAANPSKVIVVLRPLLRISRDELRAYIGEREQSGKFVVRDPNGNLWREDATNAQSDRFRTFVRHEIIPVAKERNPRLLDTLTRTMDLIADEDDYMAELAHDAAAATVQWTGSGEDRNCLLLPAFCGLPMVLQRRIVFQVLNELLGKPNGSDVRVEHAAVHAVLAGFTDDGVPNSGYKTNIQGNLAVSANKSGVRIEPMVRYRLRTGKA